MVNNSYHGGFTLIELLVALAIIAVLAIVAIPSYETQMMQGRRCDATTALTSFAQRVERSFLENGNYSGATTALYKESSDGGYYTLSITATESSYQLQATPGDIQSQDTLCGSYTLDEKGQRGITGSGSVTECW